MNRAVISIVALSALMWLGCGDKGKQNPAADAGTVTPDAATAPPGGATEVKGLKTVAAFAGVTDPKARSAAIFAEVAKVLQHPRCTNCHPVGDRPTQGDKMRPHEPPITRGKDGFGVVGMRCTTCHTDATVELGDRSIPGAPHWHLAPKSMGWVGLDSAAICAQLKDKDRNGNRDLAAIEKHFRDDPLVAWGWAPGSGREAAPGDQATTAALVSAWVKTGAHCPPATKK